MMGGGVRYLKDLGQKEKSKTNRAGNIYADPFIWEQLGDRLRHECLCIANKSWLQCPHYILLHATLSDGMAGDTYCSSVILQKLAYKERQISFTCSNKDQSIIFDSSVHSSHSIHMPLQKCMLLVGVSMFADKTNSPRDPASVAFHQNLLPGQLQRSQLTTSSLQTLCKLTFFTTHRDWTANVRAFLLSLFLFFLFFFFL